MDIVFNYLQTNALELMATVIGLLYLYLEYAAKKSMWIASIIMAVLYIYIFYISEMYAMSLIYVYFFFASIVGWIQWNHSPQVTILRMPRTYWLTVSIATLFTSLLIFILLKLFPTTQLYITVGDTLATALGVVAIVMAAKRWAEQWCLLIPANLITAVILMIQQEYSPALMFLIYFIVSIMGYIHWVKLSENAPTQ